MFWIALCITRRMRRTHAPERLMRRPADDGRWSITYALLPARIAAIT